MISKTTFKRIAYLGQAIADAAKELEQHLSEVADAADSQLAACASDFTYSYADRTPLHKLTGAYSDGRERLLHAAIAAGNLRELAKRAATTKSHCASWDAFQQHDNYSYSKEIISVCDNAMREMNMIARPLAP